MSAIGVRWTPEASSHDDCTWAASADQLISASLVAQPGEGTPQVALATVEDELRLMLAPDDGRHQDVIAAVRTTMAMPFSAGNEVTSGEPPRFRGSTGPEVTLAITDLSVGEPTDAIELKVHVAVPHRPYVAMYRGHFAGDLRRQLLHELKSLPCLDRAQADVRLQELGALLLQNTITVPAVHYLRQLAPRSVTLRVDDVLAHLPWGVAYDASQAVGTAGRRRRSGEFLWLEYAMGQQIAIEAPITLWARPRRLRKMLIISDPTGDLPNAVVEAESIRSQVEKGGGVRVDELRGPDAHRVAVMKALASGGYDMIHYAGHSTFDVNTPSESAWRLHDGPLTAVELKQNAEANPPLFVFASSCQAGRTAECTTASSGKSVLGLASGLLSAGVLGYVGSFWPIPDNDSAQLAVQFYRLLLRGEGVADALRAAKRMSRQKQGSALLWGGLTLFGNPSCRLPAGL